MSQPIRTIAAIVASSQPQCPSIETMCWRRQPSGSSSPGASIHGIPMLMMVVTIASR
jgi:hypothetical protein